MTAWRKVHEAFDASRRAGHSWAAARGARESGGVVICWTMEQARRLTEETNAEAISVNFVDSLRGRPRPMVIDNQVVSMMAAEIMKLEGRLERDQLAYARLAQRVDELETTERFLCANLRSIEAEQIDAELRGAFLALAIVGLAIAGGELLASARLVNARFPDLDALSFAKAGAIRRLTRATWLLMPEPKTPNPRS